ncbi:hypothetical protein BJS_05151 [Bradyrhizobium japonicum SEMIA 5079]|nr:hypothetical protein BJS_05151 [Bradyrhizobium japonicum SEMIA 5079]MCS3982310.1 hypothetical protein [Bradyrhizobium japonicum]
MATLNRRNLPGDYSELLPICPSRVAWSKTKMAHFPRSLSSLTDRPRRLALLALLAMAALPSTADARIGGYDGIWNVTFATTRGNCSSGYSVPFTVTGGRVSSAGGGRVSGRVNRSGAVAVQVSVGASHASGGGRLAGMVGAGSWNGIISGDRCSGTWHATRS